jgi:hypothetical protein
MHLPNPAKLIHLITLPKTWLYRPLLDLSILVLLVSKHVHTKGSGLFTSKIVFLFLLCVSLLNDIKQIYIKNIR